MMVSLLLVSDVVLNLPVGHHQSLKYTGRDCCVVVIVWYLNLQLPVQSVPITTKVVSLKP